MRSISYSAPARALAAALVVAALAIGASAYADGRGPPGVGGTRGQSHALGMSPHGHGGGAPQFGQQDGCAGGLALSSPFLFGDADAEVESLSRDTQDYIKACQCATQQCIADALDKYAEALAAVAPRLPRNLQDMPNVVARAAQQVRAARTKGQAISALRAAIAVIHKDISLVRAEEPAALESATRSGGAVAQTLDVASLSLQRAGGL